MRVWIEGPKFQWELLFMPSVPHSYLITLEVFPMLDSGLTVNNKARTFPTLLIQPPGLRPISFE